MAKHSRTRESILQRRRKRRKAKRNKVKNLLKERPCTNKQLACGDSAQQQSGNFDSTDDDASSCSVFDHLRVIDAAGTLTPFELTERPDKNEDDTSDYSASNLTPKMTRIPRKQYVKARSFEQNVQKIPGFARVCKELKITDPLEVGFELWKRQGAFSKSHFSFLNHKC